MNVDAHKFVLVLQQGKKHHEYAMSVWWNVHHNSDLYISYICSYTLIYVSYTFFYMQRSWKLVFNAILQY